MAAAGCKAKPKWYTSRPEPVRTNMTMSAFQDERYIWENWEYGTNRADSVKSK